MATKKITFDPEAGVAYPCDLIMNVGADFSATFNIVDTANTGFNFSTTNSVGLNTVSGWTGSSQMTKSTAIGSTAFYSNLLMLIYLMVEPFILYLCQYLGCRRYTTTYLNISVHNSIHCRTRSDQNIIYISTFFHASSIC